MRKLIWMGDRVEIDVDDFIRYDVDEIVRCFAAEGFEVSDLDAMEAWAAYSDLYCAGWLNMRGCNSDWVVASCRNFLEEIQ